MKYADELLLYAVTDRSWLGGKTLYEEVEHAIQGGVTFVQLREKRLEETAFLKEAQEIQKLCKKYHVPFVINDNVEIAARIHADGVHIGQSDMEVKKARERLGNERIIGVSAQTVEQAVRAEEGRRRLSWCGGGIPDRFQGGCRGSGSPDATGDLQGSSDSGYCHRRHYKG